MLISGTLACRIFEGLTESADPAIESPADQPDGLAPDSPEIEEADAPSLTTGGEILFQDDFSSNANGWVEETRSNDYGDMTKEVVDGVYRISILNKQSFNFVLTSIPDFRGKDFVLTLDVTIQELNASPGDLSLEFSLREADGVNGKHYSYKFYNDGSYYGEVWSTSSYESAVEILEQRSTSTLLLEPGITNTFSISADGESFTLYINEEMIDAVVDGTINEAGDLSINIGLSDADQSVTLEFDNLMIESLPSSPDAPDISDEPPAEAQPVAPPETTPSCNKWDQITLDMAGDVVCVYGIAFSHQGKSRIDFSPEKNSFFLIDGTYYYPNLAEGECVVAEKKVEVFDGKIPFMTIKGDLYKCEPWMLE